MSYIAPDSHRAHGERAKYVVEKCRCPECREAIRLYELKRTHAINRPDEVWQPYVSAREARRHVLALREIGIGLKTIAALSGVAHGSLSKLIYGDPRRNSKPSKRIRPATAEKILAVNASRAKGAQCIPAAPTWRLLDELLERGFTRTFLAQRLVHPEAVSLQLHRDRVRASTARKVEELHRSLRGIDAPPRRSRWDNREAA